MRIIVNFRLEDIIEPVVPKADPEPAAVKAEIKEENPDADSDFLSDSDEEADVKKEKKDASDIKQDPDIEMTQERMETLEEFKAR